MGNGGSVTTENAIWVILIYLVGRALIWLWFLIADFRRFREKREYEERMRVTLPDAKSTYWPWNKRKRK